LCQRATEPWKSDPRVPVSRVNAVSNPFVEQVRHRYRYDFVRRIGKGSTRASLRGDVRGDGETCAVLFLFSFYFVPGIITSCHFA